MNRTKVFTLSLMFVLLLAASAYGLKRIYKARLSTNNVLHQVVGDVSAGGSAILRAARGGYAFQGIVRGLSGDPIAMILHGPATAEETEDIIFALCGEEPSAMGPCPVLDGNGNVIFNGIAGGALLHQWNQITGRDILGRDFREMLGAGLVYINVSTALNPEGEARGQFDQIFP